MGKQIIDGFQVVLTDEAATSRGCFWSGDILHMGRKIGTAENMGDGGQTRIDIPNAQDRQRFALRAFKYAPGQHEAAQQFAGALLDDYA